MTLGNGWALTSRQWRQIYLLEWLYDRAGGKPDNYVTIGRPDIGLPFPGSASPEEMLAESVQDLFQQRLADYFVYAGDVPNVPPRIALTSAGVTEVDQIRRRRADLVARRTAVRDALLRWLYELTANDNNPTEIEDFSHSAYSCFLGCSAFFTATEISDAARWLQDRGYATGGVGEDDGAMRMAITSAGRQRVESGRSTSEDRGWADGTHVSVDSSPGAIVNVDSPGASGVSLVVTMTKEDQHRISTVADYLELVAHQVDLPERDAQRIPGLVTDLRALAQEPAPDRGRLQRLLGSTRELTIATASIPLGAGLLALVEQTMHALGLG